MLTIGLINVSSRLFIESALPKYFRLFNSSDTKPIFHMPISYHYYENHNIKYTKTHTITNILFYIAILIYNHKIINHIIVFNFWENCYITKKCCT